MPAADRELRRRYVRALRLLSEAPADCSNVVPGKPVCGRCWPCRIWTFLDKAAAPLSKAAR